MADNIMTPSERMSYLKLCASIGLDESDERRAELAQLEADFESRKRGQCSGEIRARCICGSKEHEHHRPGRCGLA